jgi:DNA invertase Pin-like site-specific DNA recombinase
MFRRVSSQGQGSKGTSLEKQRKWGLEWIESKQGELLKDQQYIQSGEKCLKEHHKEILKFIEDHNVTHFLVYNFDRLARDFLSGICFIKELFDRKIILITSTGVYKDLNNPRDLFTVIFALLMAHLERQNINSRTLNGIISKLKMGLWPRKNIPFGYEKDELGRLRIIGELEPVIHRIYGLFHRHQCYAAVARKINEKFGEILPYKLNDKKVKRILTDTIYIGKAEHAGETILFSNDDNEDFIDTRIIKNDLFDQVQMIVASIAEKNGSKNAENKYLKPIKQFIMNHGFEAGIDLFNWIPPCPDCQSCRYVVKNGKKKLKVRTVKRYRCEQCRRDFTFPYYSMIKRMEELNRKVCPACMSVLHFDEEDHPLYAKLKVIRCTSCGNSFFVWADEASDYVKNSIHNDNKKY